MEAVSSRVNIAGVRRAISALTIAALGCVALAARGSATMVVPKDFAALCSEADLIFVGTVTDVGSRWSDPAIQSIETLVTFGDLTWVRGTPQSTVTLRFGGGTVDGLREEFAGVPHFAVGDRRVIFAHAGTFVSPIVGFDQGALPVVKSAAGDAVIDDRTHGGTVTHFASTGPVPLDEFLARIREQLASPTPGAP